MKKCFTLKVNIYKGTILNVSISPPKSIPGRLTEFQEICKGATFSEINKSASFNTKTVQIQVLWSFHEEKNTFHYFQVRLQKR